MASKAIVVFYMSGGHDGYNMLVPLDSYDRYAEYRGSIANTEGSLIPLGIGQGNLAIHGNFQRMAGLIQSGMAAPILGCGGLVEPTTRAQYDAKSVEVPRFLFSHNHQQSFSKGAHASDSGWAGRMLDTWYAGSAAPAPISPAITTNDDRELVSPETMDISQVQSEGGNWKGVSGSKLTAIRNLTEDESYDHVVERVAQYMFGNAIDNQDYLADLLGQYQASGKLNTRATIASKLIAAADVLGHERQIIHVNAPGGFDTHADQFDSLNETYIGLDNLYVDFIEELESYGVADQVVCITASEFGRSLRPNNRGTDHGWGSNHLVWGRPVHGGQAIGDFIDYDDPDYWTKHKRLIPKIADVQIHATLARWFGLTEGEIDSLFPTLANFDQRDLSFLGN